MNVNENLKQEEFNKKILCDVEKMQKNMEIIEEVLSSVVPDLCRYFSNSKSNTLLK